MSYNSNMSVQIRRERHALVQSCKGVGMIRAEIGLKNRQIITETYSFRCFLIL